MSNILLRGLRAHFVGIIFFVFLKYLAPLTEILYPPMPPNGAIHVPTVLNAHILQILMSAVFNIL